MNEGISADEACRARALTQEDFVRMCNEDGSLKGQTQTTTFSLKNDDSKSTTMDNTALQVGLAGIVLLVVVIAYILIRKRRLNKKQF